MGFEISPSWIATSPAPKPILSPVPVAWDPSLGLSMLYIGLVVAAPFFTYETTSSIRNRGLSKQIATAAVASVFLIIIEPSHFLLIGRLGFGSLLLVLATGVYV